MNTLAIPTWWSNDQILSFLCLQNCTKSLFIIYSLPFLHTSLIKAILRNGTLWMRCTNLLTFLRHLKKMHKGCLGTFLYHPLLHLEVWQVWLHSATSWNLFQKLLREAQSLQPVVFIHQVWTITSYNTYQVWN